MQDYDVSDLDLPTLAEGYHWELMDLRDNNKVYLTITKDGSYGQSVAGVSMLPKRREVRAGAKRLARNHMLLLALNLDLSQLPKTPGDHWELDTLLLGGGTVELSLGSGSYDEINRKIRLNRPSLEKVIKRIYFKRAKLAVFNQRDFKLPELPDGATWRVKTTHGIMETRTSIELVHGQKIAHTKTFANVWLVRFAAYRLLRRHALGAKSGSKVPVNELTRL